MNSTLKNSFYRGIKNFLTNNVLNPPASVDKKSHFMLLSLLCLHFVILGCASSDLAMHDSKRSIHDSVLVWPQYPQTPRIQFIKSVHKPGDLGIKASWFKKILNRLFGDEQSQNFITRPYGVFADQNRLYVTDPGSMLVHVFDLRDKKYFNIQKVKEGYLQSPLGIASERDGTIYVSDSVLKRVFVFSQKGEYLREIGSDSLFKRPAGLVVDEDRLYVIDTHLHGVLVFAKREGNFLYSFGTNGFQEGEFNYPTNIFISKGDLLHITDSMNFRVQVFDKEGQFISSFGKPGDGFGDFSKPKGIAVDSDENIYVADAHFDTVQIFNKQGELLLTFGGSGSDRGEMILPAGIFIDNQDRIYVADSYNHRVLIFQYMKQND